MSEPVTPVKKPESPVSVRLPPTLRRTLDAHLQTKDQVRSRFIRSAITEKLLRERASAREQAASPFPK